MAQTPTHVGVNSPDEIRRTFAKLLKGYGGHTHDAADIVSGELDVARGGTDLASYAIGDLLYASGATTLAKLAVGTAGYVLTAGATLPAWAAIPTQTSALLSATHTDSTAAAVVRGDIIAGIGVVPKWERLARGTQYEVLTQGADEPGWGQIDLTKNGAGESITGILPTANGGTGVNNAGTITNATNTTITGGGTLALGGYTATVAASGTVLMTGVSQNITAEKKFSHGALKMYDAGPNFYLYFQAAANAANRAVNFPVMAGDRYFAMVTDSGGKVTLTAAAAEVTGILPTANGGLGVGPTANTVPYYTSGTAYTVDASKLYYNGTNFGVGCTPAYTMQSGGGLGGNYTGFATTAETLNGTHYLVTANLDANTMVFTLPAATNKGQTIWIYAYRSGILNTCTVQRAGSDVIRGGGVASQTSVVLTPNITYVFIADGVSDWYYQ